MVPVVGEGLVPPFEFGFLPVDQMGKTHTTTTLDNRLSGNPEHFSFLKNNFSPGWCDSVGWSVGL